VFTFRHAICQWSWTNAHLLELIGQRVAAPHAAQLG
jgi:hypothetical protein